MTVNLAITMPPFTDNLEEEYERTYNSVVMRFKILIGSGVNYFTLDEIKEAFAEASKEFEENNN